MSRVSARGSARFVTRGRNSWHGDGRAPRHSSHLTVWGHARRLSAVERLISIIGFGTLAIVLLAIALYPVPLP